MSKPRPKIGIDLDHEHDGRRWVYKSPTRYLEAVVRAGGQPVLIAPGDPREASEILADLDGIVMTGGDDVHPALLGEKADGRPMRLLSVQREAFVLDLARAVLERGTPCLGVCLGCQALNVAAGGSIWFDLYAERADEELAEHRNGASHGVRAVPGGWLDRTWHGEAHELVSHHHQAVRELGQDFVLEAVGEDGVIEAMSHSEHDFVVAVQWHPEVQFESAGGAPLLSALVDASQRRAH